jgi:hypothetical protein
MNNYDELIEKLKERFPNAKFVVSCFKTIDEIETKILSNEDQILYVDCYVYGKEEYNDVFIITKNKNKDFIYYCDVIDQLIEYNFIRNDCDHRFMENIREFNESQRNNNSLKKYCSFWGS